MLSRWLRLLRDRNFLLVSSVVLGFALGRTARLTQNLTLPALAVAMTVSVTEVQLRDFRPLSKVVQAALAGIVLTYLLNGTALLALTRLLMPEADVWTGIVLLAATPPGVAVIPFSYLLGGDIPFALVGSVGVYLSAVLLMPFIVTLFLGSAVVSPMRLIVILLQLLVIPIVVSRLVVASPLNAPIKRWRGSIVNWAFALVIFTVIGLNRDRILQQPQILVWLLFIGLCTNFGLGFVLEWVLQRMGIQRGRRLTSVLMGTIKNTSLTAATALALFSERASLPAAVVSVTNVLYLVWLGVWWRNGTRDTEYETRKTEA
ncbi:MAG: bile acid:sodium symporter family protein [Anaerolineae bacterium]